MASNSIRSSEEADLGCAKFYDCAGKKGKELFSGGMQLRVKNYQTSQYSSHAKDPHQMDPALKVLQLTEALKALLEAWGSEREQESARKQVSTDTADVILRWLKKDEVSTRRKSECLL